MTTHVEQLTQRGGPELVNRWLDEMRIFTSVVHQPSGYWRWDRRSLAWSPKAKIRMKLWILNGRVETENTSDPADIVDR